MAVIGYTKSIAPLQAQLRAQKFAPEKLSASQIQTIQARAYTRASHVQLSVPTPPLQPQQEMNAIIDTPTELLQSSLQMGETNSQVASVARRGSGKAKCL